MRTTRRSAAPLRVRGSTRLDVFVCSLAGGTGASSAAGLLAAGLAGVLDAADPQTPVALLDPAPAGGSPWPYWLARERTAGPLGPQPARPADL